MTGLAITLDDTDFATLVERARALIPSLAPNWTDFNLHDPGITLLELLAFTADAQIYSLGRLRRDERRAYAALMGLRPQGPRAAVGTLWPQHGAPAVAAGRWLAAGTPATAPGDAPSCRTTQGVWFTPAQLTRIVTRLPDGTEQDHTAANDRPGASFAPFGAAPTPGAELRLQCDGALVRGCNIAAGEQPVIALGIKAEDFGPQPDTAPPAEPPAAILRTAVAGPAGFDQPIAILADDTGAFARTGALLLRLPDALAGPTAPDSVVLVLRLAGGAFPLPPRSVRIALNVLPVRQLAPETVEQRATGLPDQSITLSDGGPAAGETVQLRVLTPGGAEEWQPITDLEAAGPDDRVFLSDVATGDLRFGNGVNGAVPPQDATIRVDYLACAGAAGNLPPQQDWIVAPIGIGAPFENLTPLAGGADADSLDSLRHAARVQIAQARPFVTDADLVAAALAAPGLHVGRAEVIDDYDPIAPCLADRLGTRTLVALRQRRRSEADAPPQPEDRGWLTAVERHLRPGLPLGERLRVIGPGYVDLTLRASLVTRGGIDTAAVVTQAQQLLQDRLAPLPRGDVAAWPLGRPVAVLTLAGWLRRIAGVVAVQNLTVNGLAADGVTLRPHELPRLALSPGDITAASGGAS
jgi:hypothetical protein